MVELYDCIVIERDPAIVLNLNVVEPDTSDDDVDIDVLYYDTIGL